jgi:L,D-transpeptidase ErfK/SrfK
MSCLEDEQVVAANLYLHSSHIIGTACRYKVKKNETLLEIARIFGLGYNSIVDANPGIDPFIPPPGSDISIPTAWVLPDAPIRKSIVINLPELRLYYFPGRHSDSVTTFPLGVGDEGKDTPLGKYTVIKRIVAPAWHVPESIRKKNTVLPKIVPPGPDNPMGSHALRLSRGAILIHGTDKPWGIGRRSSHGCLRLYPEDIVKLFPLVSIGTPVIIVNQPVKAALRGGKVFLEVHRYEGVDYINQARKVLNSKKLLNRIDDGKLKRALLEKTGLPVDITK